MKMICRTLIMAVLVLASNAGAQLYKGVDADGNVVYSDQPFDQAEKYSAPPISVVSGKSLKEEASPVAEEAPKQERKPLKYTDFAIASPTKGQTLWNDPEVTVTLRLKPALNAKEGHNVWLFLDGKPVVKNSRAMSHQLGRLDRGAHSIQALLKDGAGKLIATSRSVVVYIKHGSAQ